MSGTRGLLKIGVMGIIAILFACPARATWGVVQQTQSSYVSGTSAGAQFAMGVTAGDLLLVQASWGDTTHNVNSVSDTLGNTFTSAAGPVRQGSSESTQLFYAANVNGGTDKVTVSMSGSAHLVLFVYEIAGAQAAMPLDAAATGNGNNTSAVTASIATSTAGEFVFAGIGNAGHSNWDKPGPGYAGLQQNAYGLGEFQTVSSAGMAVTGTGTLSNSNTWTAIVAAFIPSPGSISGGGGGATLTAIQVTPASPTLSMSQTIQFTATGIFSDGSQQNLTNSVTWGSTVSSVATITSSGLATAAGHGTTSITAASGSISGSTPLTVEGTLSSIQVTPANYSILVGSNQQFTATGTFSDGTTENITAEANWTSSNTGVATVNASGMATGVAAGITTITATSGAVTGSTSSTITAPVQNSGGGSTAPSPLVQADFQFFTAYYVQNPPTAGGSSCSPAPCIAQTFLNPNGAGNMILVWVSWKSGGFTLSGVSDSGGNAYTHVPGYPISNSNGIVDDFWIAYNVASAQDNKVTAGFGSGTVKPASLQLLEYSGTATSNALDGSSHISSNPNCTAPCTLQSAPSPTTTQASELVVSVFDLLNCGANCSSTLFTTGSGWTPDANCNGCMAWGGQNLGGAFLIEHAIETATGSFTASSIENTTNFPSYDAYIFTFKRAP